jgi:FkbM family methyltransferase
MAELQLRPSRGHPVLRKVSYGACRQLARSPGLSRAFLLLLGGFFRAVGDFPFKKQIVKNLRFAPWPAVDLPRRTVEVCPGHTISLVPHIIEFDFTALLSRQLGYEEELFAAVAERIRGYDAFVEIGSNVGVYSVFFAKYRRPGAPVYCFEPAAEAVRRLHANVGPQPPEHFYVIPAAVADTCGLLTFYEPAAHLTNGSLLESFAAQFETPVRKNLVPSVDGAVLEEMVRAHERVLLKIDVEGAEARVIHALEGLILSKRPDIIMEVLGAFVPELNTLKVLTENYRLFLVTKDGLEEKPQFVGHEHYRDYYLFPK